MPDVVSVPPPESVKESLPLLWLIDPLTVNVLPLVALTLRLLPMTTGAATVLLPLSLIVAVPVVLDKVNVLAPDGLMS